MALNRSGPGESRRSKAQSNHTPSVAEIEAAERMLQRADDDLRSYVEAIHQEAEGPLSAKPPTTGFYIWRLPCPAACGYTFQVAGPAFPAHLLRHDLYGHLRAYHREFLGTLDAAPRGKEAPSADNA